MARISLLLLALRLSSSSFVQVISPWELVLELDPVMQKALTSFSLVNENLSPVWEEEVDLRLPDKEHEHCCSATTPPRGLREGTFGYLVPSGRCSMTLKTHQASISGASAIFVYDREGQETEAGTLSRKPFAIPAVRLTNKDAVSKILEYLERGEQVRLRLSLQAVPGSGKRSLELFIHVNQLASYSIFERLYVARFILGEAVSFSPVYHFSQDESSFCLSGTQYCLHTSDNKFSAPEWRVEQVNQLCLWQTFGDSVAEEQKFWRYMTSLWRSWQSQPHTSLSELSSAAKEEIDFDAKQNQTFQECLLHNSPHVTNEDIPVIEANSVKSRKVIIAHVPQLLLDRRPIRAFENPNSLRLELCDQFKNHPELCKETVFADKPLLAGFGFLHGYLLWVAGVLLIVLVLVLMKGYVARTLHKEVRRSVQELSANYIKVKDVRFAHRDTQLAPSDDF